MSHTAVHTALSAEALRAGYEQLRGEALDSRGIYRGFGYALLVRAGLASWLLACREPVSTSPRPAQSSSTGGLHSELVMVITAMALDTGKAKA